MPLVLPAGLRPEGCAGAEYRPEISHSCRHFTEAKVGAEKAAASSTTLLLTGSKVRTGSVPALGSREP